MTVEHRKIAQHFLPLSEREALCRELLSEFGVTRVTVRADDHELIHSCVMPWHKDKSPSASLNYERLVYKCLACNSSGGLYWLIEMVRDVSKDSARKWLEAATGLSDAGWSLEALLSCLDAIWHPEPSRKAPMPHMSPRALDPWRFVHPYVTDVEPPCRGVPLANAQRLQIGWDPDRDRIVFPHFWKGSLVGWQTRRISAKDPLRWQMSPDFPRDRTIYDYDATRRHAVVVEGMVSVARHAHHQHMEATFGSSVTDAQVRHLAQHPRLTLFMDNDTAGWRSVLGHTVRKQHTPGLVERLASYSDVRVVVNPWSADPADMDDATVATLVEAAVPAAVWQPPAEIRCWLCNQVHDGACEGGE